MYKRQAYNSASTIEKVIHSVIDQTETNWELIVIDDGSTDETVSLIEKYTKDDPRIHLLMNEVNRGVAETRNRGLEEARGNYIAFLDSDEMCIRDSHMESGISVLVRVWCKTDDYWPVYFSMQEHVKTAFDEEKITIPFNQMDIHIVETVSYTHLDVYKRQADRGKELPL